MKPPNLGKKPPPADGAPPDANPQPGAQAPASEATEPADAALPVEPAAAQAARQPEAPPQPPDPPPDGTPSLAEQLAADAAATSRGEPSAELLAEFEKRADTLWTDLVVPKMREQSRVYGRTQAAITMPAEPEVPDAVVQLLVQRARKENITAGLSKTAGYPTALLLNWGAIR